MRVNLRYVVVESEVGKGGWEAKVLECDYDYIEQTAILLNKALKKARAEFRLNKLTIQKFNAIVQKEVLAIERECPSAFRRKQGGLGWYSTKALVAAYRHGYVEVDSEGLERLIEKDLINLESAISKFLVEG